MRDDATLPPRVAPVDAAAWRALRDGAVVATLPRVGGLRLSGTDRVDFLHGQLAHDVRGLPEGGARRSLLLDAKGHARAEAIVLRRSCDLHLAVEDGALPWFEAHLRAHVIFDQVELEPLAETFAALTLQGPEVPALLTALDWPLPEPGRYATVPFGDASLLLSRRRRSAPGGVDVHLPVAAMDEVRARLAAAGAAWTAAATLEPSRIAAGLPRVATEAGAGVLPQEAGLEDAFSTRKGCYLGQEIMARIEARGRLKRGLSGLRFEDDAPPLAVRESSAGDEVGDATAEEARTIRLDGRRVGRLGGVALHPELGPIGLAVLRHDVAADAELEVGVEGAHARRSALPFAAR